MRVNVSTAPRILIIGATSAIARAVARQYAQHNGRVFLVARHQDRLATVAADLAAHGAAIAGTFVLDARDTHQHRIMTDAAVAALGALDIVLIAYGALPDQRACEASVDLTLDAIAVNGTSAIALMTSLATILERQKSGTLAVISSVAGDRARRGNFVYGVAKGMVTLFAQGLRSRFRGTGVQVVTIKPGFVDTPMTSGFRKGMLWTTPEHVARDIVKAIAGGRSTVYTPRFWQPVMFVIRVMPAWLLDRLGL